MRIYAHGQFCISTCESAASNNGLQLVKPTPRNFMLPGGGREQSM